MAARRNQRESLLETAATALALGVPLPAPYDPWERFNSPVHYVTTGGFVRFGPSGRFVQFRSHNLRVPDQLVYSWDLHQPDQRNIVVHSWDPRSGERVL